MGKTEIAPLCSRNVYSWKQGNYVKLMLSGQNNSSLWTAAAAATAVMRTEWSFLWHKRQSKKKKKKSTVIYITCYSS